MGMEGQDGEAKDEIPIMIINTKKIPSSRKSCPFLEYTIDTGPTGIVQNPPSHRII